jgi:plasmid stability protein
MRLRNLRRLELEAQNYCAAADCASWYHQTSIEAETREISRIS